MKCKAIKAEVEFSTWVRAHRVTGSSRKKVAWCNHCKQEDDQIELELLQRDAFKTILPQLSPKRQFYIFIKLTYDAVFMLINCQHGEFRSVDACY